MTVPKLLLLVTIASFAIAACDTNDGMSEKAGAALDKTDAEIDKAATDFGNAVEDACEDVKEGAGAKDTDC